MKKSLSLLLALTLVFSMFASVAFAAEPADANAKFEALKAEGIFKGYPDGTAGLDKEMTRAEFAVVLTRAFKLELDKAAATSYKDKGIAAHWAAGEIGAVTKAGIMTGANGFFNPKANITVEQLAKTLVVALGLKPVAGAKVEGTSTSWNAAEYVKAAIDAKLIAEATDYKVNATRATLVEASYAAIKALDDTLTVKASKALDAKTVEVTFSNDKVEKFTLDKDLVPGVATEVTVKYEGKEYKTTVTLPVVEFGVKATGAKKFTVTFGTAVDTTKVKYEVKNGSNTVNYKSVTPAEDKKSAVIEFPYALAAADYTVTVTGATDKDLTATVKVEAEKVAKIEFSSDKAPISRANPKVATVGYKVLNQYNEEINSTAVTATASTGTVTAASGTLTITSASDLVINTPVAVSLVHAATSTFASATVTAAAPARVAAVDLVALKLKDDKEIQNGLNNIVDYKIEVSLKDQYGNSVTDVTYLNTLTEADKDVIVTNSNGAVVGVGNFEYTDSKMYLKLAPHSITTPETDGVQAGTTTITVISKTTGAKDSLDVVVKESAQVSTFTMNAPTLIVAGEYTEIPFTALDQFGKAIDHPVGNTAYVEDSISYAENKGDFNSISTTNGTLKFKKDVVKNKTSLYLMNPSKGTAIITIITKSNKVEQLSLNVVDAKVATTISNVKDFDLSILKDGTVSFGKDNVVVKDQYGRDMTPDYGTTSGKYRVVSESSNDSVVEDTNTIINASAKVLLTAKAKGSATVTLKLQKHNGTDFADVPNSSFTFTQKVVEKADITSYEATVSGTVYANLTQDTDGNYIYAKDLVVKGTLADGSKVTVTNTVYNYSVVSSDSNVIVQNGKVRVNPALSFGDKSEKEVPVTVVIDAANAQPLNVVLKASNAAPAATTLSLRDDFGAAHKESDGLVSVTSAAAVDTKAEVDAIAAGIVKTVDQYGVEMATSLTSVVVSNVTDGKALSAIAQGNTFTVTAVSGSKVISFKVIVK